MALLDNLMSCRDGQVLAVVAANPGSDLAAAQHDVSHLTAGARPAASVDQPHPDHPRLPGPRAHLAQLSAIDAELAERAVGE
jgi:hypothetical protein